MLLFFFVQKVKKLTNKNKYVIILFRKERRKVDVL